MLSIFPNTKNIAFYIVVNLDNYRKKFLTYYNYNNNNIILFTKWIFHCHMRLDVDYHILPLPLNIDLLSSKWLLCILTEQYALKSC